MSYRHGLPRRMGWLSLSVGLLGGCSGGPAQSSPDLSHTSLPILDGVADTATDAVLVVRHQVGNGQFCSGVLLTPDLVLSARHCVTTDMASGPIICAGDSATILKQVVSASDAIVLKADSLEDPGYEYLTVEEIIGFPAAETLPNCGNDLVALRLKQPVVDIEPITLRLDAEVNVGEEVEVVGFGANPPSDPDSAGYRRRRAGVRIAHVGRYTMPAGAYSTNSEFIIDEGSCSGDSGSPAFDANGEVVGLLSRGNPVTCQGMVYEQIAAHAGWLRKMIAESDRRLDPGMPDDMAPPDAGVDHELRPKESGGCAVKGTQVGSSPLAWLLAAAWLLGRRSRELRG